MTLQEITPLIEKGLPFRRSDWEDDFYYFYDTDNSRFVRHTYMGDLGDDYDMIEYTIGLDMDDLKAKDWIVLTWEVVK